MKIYPIVFLLFLCLEGFSKTVPGVIVNYSPASTGIYLGTPSICLLPDGTYLVSHDYFGPKSNSNRNAKTEIFRSFDKGNKWEKIATVNQFWSNLFYLNGDVYLIGTDNSCGNCVIRKSNDKGITWSEIVDESRGIIRYKTPDKGFHTSAVSMVEHNGRIWRPFELTRSDGEWGYFESMIMSAPINSDILNGKNWIVSSSMSLDIMWGKKYHTWLEGGAVLTPENDLVIILRVDRRDDEMAAILHVKDSGKLLSFDPQKDFIRFPGGCKKFVVRYDSISRMYWSLSNWVPDTYRKYNVERARNTLALVSSKDLREWNVNKIVLHDSNIDKSGFQYVDWRFEGNDIVFVSRTAFYDGENYANSQHNSNYITFHRIKNFRDEKEHILWNSFK